MRMLFFILALVAAPLTSWAQDYNDSPLIVVNRGKVAASPAKTTAAAPTSTAAAADAGKTIPWLPNFPEAAITSAGQNTAGNTNPVVASPASPATPANAANAPSMATPASPGTPVSPANPTDKLWPRDTVPIFVKSCVGFHVELVAPCTCVITNLMLAMPHDEFLELSANGTIENDRRLIESRQRCLSKATQKE